MVIKTFVLSIFEWPLKAGFTVAACFKPLRWPNVHTLNDMLLKIQDPDQLRLMSLSKCVG